MKRRIKEEKKEDFMEMFNNEFVNDDYYQCMIDMYEFVCVT